MSESGVKVVGVFQDRRRKDVSFLDQVILRLDGPGVNIHLGQGRRVQVSDLQTQVHFERVTDFHPESWKSCLILQNIGLWPYLI